LQWFAAALGQTGEIQEHDFAEEGYATGVSVSVKKNLGTITDIDGNF